jgi:gamma-glutamyltranspeptidase/glutathione hydrolase
LARDIAGDLAAAGSPITADDLAGHAARMVAPLSVRLSVGTIHNLPPPTQGVASLMILALFERLGITEADGFDFIHCLVEATKQAFLLRDAHVADPDIMDVDPETWLKPDFLDERAQRIDRKRALAWPRPSVPGDTVWLGAIDGAGRAVSFIQSVYWEFGSGVVLRDTGILWQNRGSSFALRDGRPNRLAPGRRPFHTLNPALARLDDGRVMTFGTMGGEGQPQTQAAVFARHVLFGHDLQAAITAPRWLLGRTWGAETTTLKLESRIDAEVISALASAGHDVETVEPYSDMMGHAGALVRHADGRLEGASDPRSDGSVAAF